MARRLSRLHDCTEEPEMKRDVRDTRGVKFANAGDGTDGEAEWRERRRAEGSHLLVDATRSVVPPRGKSDDHNRL